MDKGIIKLTWEKCNEADGYLLYEIIDDAEKLLVQFGMWTYLPLYFSLRARSIYLSNKSQNHSFIFDVV